LLAFLGSHFGNYRVCKVALDIETEFGCWLNGLAQWIFTGRYA
jgi:hypothetical protein